MDSALSSLERKELIQARRDDAPGEAGLAFRHALIRDAAYESLTKQARAELHERFANWMEDDQRERVAELEAIARLSPRAGAPLSRRACSPRHAFARASSGLRAG